LRYDLPALRRFLLFSLPLLLLTMALFHFALDALGKAPSPSALSRLGGRELPAYVLLGSWFLESLGLAALYLLINGRTGRLLAGLLTGWIAWIFRGPLLVVAVVVLGGLPAAPWWSLAFCWWILYSICGLVLGGVAAASGLQS
jgi:hypothetical protein